MSRLEDTRPSIPIESIAGVLSKVRLRLVLKGIQRLLECAESPLHGIVQAFRELDRSVLNSIEKAVPIAYVTNIFGPAINLVCVPDAHVIRDRIRVTGTFKFVSIRHGAGALLVVSGATEKNPRHAGTLATVPRMRIAPVRGWAA